MSDRTKIRPVYWGIAVIVVLACIIGTIKFYEYAYLAGDPCAKIDDTELAQLNPVFDPEAQRRSGGAVVNGFGVVASRSYAHGGCISVLTRRACKVYGPAIVQAELSGKHSYFNVPDGMRALLSPTGGQVSCTMEPNS